MHCCFKLLPYILLFCVFVTNSFDVLAVDGCPDFFTARPAVVVIEDRISTNRHKIEFLLRTVDFFSAAIRKLDYAAVTDHISEVIEYHHWLKSNAEHAGTTTFSSASYKELLGEFVRRISALDQQYEGIVKEGGDSETAREAFVPVLKVLIEQSFDIFSKLKKHEASIARLDALAQGNSLREEASTLINKLIRVMPLHQRGVVLPDLIWLTYIYSTPTFYLSTLHKLQNTPRDPNKIEWFESSEFMKISQLPTEALEYCYLYFLSTGSLASLLIMSEGVSRFSEEKVKDTLKKFRSIRIKNNELDNTESLITSWFSNFATRSILGTALNGLGTNALALDASYVVNQEHELRKYFPQFIYPMVTLQLNRLNSNKASKFDSAVYVHLLQTWIRNQKKS